MLQPTASQWLTMRNTLLGALNVKAEALYALHDFEHALATFHKCVHIRPDLADKFKRVSTQYRSLPYCILRRLYTHYTFYYYCVTVMNKLLIEIGA